MRSARATVWGTVLLSGLVLAGCGGVHRSRVSGGSGPPSVAQYAAIADAECSALMGLQSALSRSLAGHKITAVDARKQLRKDTEATEERLREAPAPVAERGTAKLWLAWRAVSDYAATTPVAGAAAAQAAARARAVAASMHMKACAQ